MTNKKKPKRKQIRVSEVVIYGLFFFFVILMYDMLFGISFSSTHYAVNEKNVLEIPSFLSVVSNKMGEIQFKTYRSMAAISKDMKKIRRNYQNISCRGSDYYYNQNENYTISYQIHRGVLFNYLTIQYQDGKFFCSANDSVNNPNSNCRFIKTYYVDFVKSIQESEKLYVTLSMYQGSTETIELPSIWRESLIVGRNYEFMFEQVGSKKSKTSNISDIFESYVLVDIQPTGFVGMEQKQEPICR